MRQTSPLTTVLAVKPRKRREWEGRLTRGKPGDLPDAELSGFRDKGAQVCNNMASPPQFPGCFFDKRLIRRVRFVLYRIAALMSLLVMMQMLAGLNHANGMPGGSDFASTDSGKDSAEMIFPSASSGSLNPIDPAIDTLYLNEIIIRSTRIHEPLRHQPVDVLILDSLVRIATAGSSISDLLTEHSSFFIRDNGPGGLATLSQRGLSPGQTQVLWEGYPVSSLSLGLADLSLFPAGLFGSAEVSPGTPSSAFGGGGSGGTLWLSSHSERAQNRMDFTQTAGTFGTYNSHLRATYRLDRWSVSVRANYGTSENDFEYHNRATGQREKRMHNAGKSAHVMAGAGYELPTGRLYSQIWLLDRNEEIPGNVLAGSSRAIQNNGTARWITGWETSYSGWNMHLSGFLENDRFHYVDPTVQIDSRFRRNRALTELEFHRPSTGRVIWRGGISGGLERVDTENYSDDHRRRRLGVRLSPELKSSGERVRVTPAIRLDAYTGFGAVLSPSTGVNWEMLADKLHLRGMISRDFNPPSFNDLYWMPGGNPDLNPERSVKAEGGMVYIPPHPLWEQLHLTGYRIWLKDGIYWLPDGSGTWSPDNIEEVDAHGLEARSELVWQAGRMGFRLDVATDWRVSQIARERFPGDQGVGRQMRYVPEWSYRGRLAMRMAPMALDVTWRWTDRRFVTSDHRSSLEPYQVVNVALTAEHEVRGMDARFHVSVRNLFNESYEVIQWYPMPGRYLEFSLGLGMPF